MEETEFGGRQKPSQMWRKKHTQTIPGSHCLPPKSYPFLLACVVAEDYGQLVPWEHLRTEPEHVTSTQHPHNQHIVSNQLFASGGSLKAWWIFAGAIATHKYRNIKQCPPIFWQLHCNFRRVCAPHRHVTPTDTAVTELWVLPSGYRWWVHQAFCPTTMLHVLTGRLNHPEVIHRPDITALVDWA